MRILSNDDNLISLLPFIGSIYAEIKNQTVIYWLLRQRGGNSLRT